MTWQILTGDALDTLRTLPDASVQCVVTSPPYFNLRDYKNPDQIGLEPTPAEYVSRLVAVFEEVKRVLRDDGTCWVNIGDSYASPGNKRNGEGEVRNLKTDRFHGGTAHLSQRRTTGDFRGRYRLRRDLTPEQQAYVLTELAKVRAISAPTQDGRL